VGGFVAYLFSTTKGHDVSLFPLIVMVNTAIVFGYLLSWFRPSVKRLRFWATVGVFLLLDLVAYYFLLYRAVRIPLVVFALIDLGELTVFSQLLRKVLSGRKPGDMSNEVRPYQERLTRETWRIMKLICL
jgi:hypothetical protein